MSRKARIEFEGAIYHVYHRGNNREYIFNENYQKVFFIKQLIDYKMVYNYEILAYVIMNNHYHLIIRTNKDPLSKIMQINNNIYSKFYNNIHKRTGHVFEERYKAKLVDNDAYLIWLLRYIHRNPIRANLCEKVWNYKWSSDFYYRNNICTIVNIEFIFDIISIDRSNALKAYSNFMLANDEEYDVDKIKIKYPNIFYSNDNIKERNELIFQRPGIDDVFNGMNFKQDDLNLIKSGSRKRYLTVLKVEFIKSALRQKYTLDEIGSYIGISQSAVTKLLKENVNN